MLGALQQLRKRPAPSPPPAASAPGEAEPASVLFCALRAAAAESEKALRAALLRHPRLSLRSSPGAGRTLFAAEAFAAGQEVLAERAFASCNPAQARGDDAALLATLRVHVGDCTLAAALPLFLQLEPNRSALAAPGVGDAATARALIAPAIHLNGFMVRGDLQLSLLVASFSNHSCEPNIHTAFRLAQDGMPELLFRAARGIAAGEELLHSYVDCSADLTDRRLRLSPYGFVCQCAACQREEQAGGEAKN